MRLLILTSSLEGTASHHLPVLLKNETISEIQVVLSQGEIKNRSKHYQRKLKKLIQIGPLGTWNGIKMRSWFGEDIKNYTRIGNLKSICSEHGITLTVVPRINSPECAEAFEGFKPDLAISLGNGYIGSKIFTIPVHGMLNIHHEILPDYQNAQSVIWQLYNGSNTTGYTIHQIDKKIDTGKVVYQETLPILFREDLATTVSSTIASLYDASAIGLNSVISELDITLKKGMSQGKGGHYTTPSWTQMKQIRREFARLKRSSQKG